MRSVPWGIALVAAACGSDPALLAPDAREAIANIDAAPLADAAAPPLVLTTSFELPSGKETWLCLRRTMTERVFLKGFETAGAAGVHHTLIAVENDGTPRADGVTTCDSGINAHRILFSAGRNTPPLELPPGVAFEVKAGERFLVHLHLFNATETPIAGTAGFRLTRAAPEEVVQRADMLLAGDVNLVIPPGESTHVGRCSIGSDATLIAVGPHMHRLGVHQRVVVERAAGSEILLDQPFSFDDQPYTLVDASLRAGDLVRVACTYDNDTGGTVYFGGGSNDEMCYARLLFYPPSEHPPVCAQ